MTHTLNQIMLLMETTLSAAYDAFAATIIYMLTEQVISSGRFLAYASFLRVSSDTKHVEVWFRGDFKFVRNTYLRFTIICLTISSEIRRILSQKI